MSRVTLAITCALAISSLALAGPPLICLPYEIGDRPTLDLDAPAPQDPRAFAAELIALLDAETQTIVRMETLRRAAFRGVIESRDEEEQTLAKTLLAALVARRDAAVRAAAQDRALEAQAARAAFDHVFARQTFLWFDDHGDPQAARDLVELTACAVSLGDDAAAWLGVARAATPLMRSSTLPEHAFAFVRALDLARAMPKGAAREHIESTLASDLETLESYLLDRTLEGRKLEPSPATREALLVEEATALVRARLQDPLAAAEASPLAGAVLGRGLSGVWGAPLARLVDEDATLARRADLAPAIERTRALGLLPPLESNATKTR